MCQISLYSLNFLQTIRPAQSRPLTSSSRPSTESETQASSFKASQFESYENVSDNQIDEDPDIVEINDVNQDPEALNLHWDIDYSESIFCTGKKR